MLKMKIHCAHDKLVPIADLKPHPKNRNNHPDDQITRLAQILEYQGWRQPIKVSRLSGFITAGHGRLLAAQKLGLSEVPVNFQEYESEAQEYADLVADNAIALWADIDVSGIKDDILKLPEINFDNLGLGLKSLNLSEFLEPDEKSDPEEKEAELKTCPNCGVLIDG